MNRAGMLLRSMCVAAIVGTVPLFVAAADAPVVARELIAVRESGKVNAALWRRQDDVFILELKVDPFIGNTIACLRGLDPSFGASPSASTTPPQGQSSRSPPFSVADALNRLVPQNVATYMPFVVADTDLNLPGSTQTVQRRPKVVQVWLLRADGAQILPSARSDGLSKEDLCRARRDPRTGMSEDEITYTFPVAGNEQAVALAIQIDEGFYIEKLR
jgi:hypothetical protein